MSNKNIKILLGFIFLFLVGVIVPKVFISDIPGVSELESDYAAMEAHIFFDNPFERLFIMKTVITYKDYKKTIVTAYTFFGFKYRSTDIGRMVEEDMAILLRR